MYDLNSPKGKPLLWRQVVYLGPFIIFIAFFLFPSAIFQNHRNFNPYKYGKLNEDNPIKSFF